MSDRNELSLLLGVEYVGFKGQDAINKLVLEKQGHIKRALYRVDVGYFDLLWGEHDYDTGRGFGLKHIIARRTEQGIDADEFLKNLAFAIENATFRKKNDRGNFEFFYDGIVMIVSPELRNHKLMFLLTAYKTHSKK